MLSKHQQSRLRNGHTITLKHEQITGSGLDLKRLGESNQKKLAKAYHSGKNVRLSLTAEEIKGQGFAHAPSRVKQTFGEGFRQVSGRGFASIDEEDMEGGALIKKNTFKPLRKFVQKNTGLSEKQTYALGRVGESALKAGVVAGASSLGGLAGSEFGPVGTAIGATAGRQAGMEANKAIWGSGFRNNLSGGAIPAGAGAEMSPMLHPMNYNIQVSSQFVPKRIGWKSAT